MNILIFINNRVLSQGLQKIIAEYLPEVVVEDYFARKDACPPDLVLFDSRENIDHLKQQFSGAHFICIDLGLKDAELACLLFCHGVHGIISPRLDVDRFCKALRTVYKGEVWVEQTHLKALLNAGHSLPDSGRFRSLSDQDKRIIRLVATGKKNRQIADLLCLSEPTVKAHLSRIYKTLKVENRSSLVALATESGWTKELA